MTDCSSLSSTILTSNTVTGNVSGMSDTSLATIPPMVRDLSPVTGNGVTNPVSSSLRHEKIIRVLASLYMENFNGANDRRAYYRALSKFSDSTLNMIENTAAWNRGNIPSHDIMYDVLIRCTEEIVREVMFLRPLFNSPSDELSAFVAGLHLTDYFTETTALETLTGQDIEIAAAYLNITLTVRHHMPYAAINSENSYKGHLASVIESKQLQAFIVENHKKADSIISYIIERKVADIEVLHTYLKNETPMQNGSL